MPAGVTPRLGPLRHESQDMQNTKLTSVLAAVALTGGLVEAQDIVDTLAADAQYSTLVTAVQSAGLVDALKGPGPLTVFAPTNAAFAALPDGALDALLADPQALTQVLLYHVVDGQLLAADVTAGGDATTLAELDVTFTVDAGGQAFVNDAPSAVDNIVDNGVIHTIDSVLDPTKAPIDLFDAIRGIPEFQLLETALVATGLDDDLKTSGPLTVFAPTDRAFLALGKDTLRALASDLDTLRDILLYHVVGDIVLAEDVLAGGTGKTLAGTDLLFNATPFGAYVNTSRVVAANRILQNGVLHTLDSVIVPPQPTIPQQLTAFPDFDTLVTAVGVAGLADTLSSPGPFTIFAPLDTAFAALPAGQLEALLADPTALAEVLTYHVVPGRLFATDVFTQSGATTVQGQDVTFSIQGGDAIVNQSKITAVDIAVGNGVIHFIDSVLTVPGS